jgi:O-antigen/teichoic acid export membrane protein
MVVMVLNFVFKIYLSYHISKEELGLFYTFMDFVSVGVILFSGYKDSLIKAYDSSTKFEEIFYWYLVSFIVFSGIMITIESIFYTFLEFEYPLYLFVLVIFFNQMMIFFSYLTSAYKSYNKMLYENIVMSVATLSGYLLFALYMEEKYALLFAFVFSFISKILFLLYNSRIKFKIKKVAFKSVIEFYKNTLYSSATYFFSAIFISLSSVVILHLFKDSNILSEFQVVVRSIFFSLVAIFVFPLNSFMFPQISKLIFEKNYKEVRRLEKKLSVYLVYFFILIVLSLSVTKYLVAFVFPTEYIQSYKMLNIMLPFLPFIAYTTFALNIIKGFGHFKYALYVRVVGSVFFFGVSYILYLLNFEASSIVYAFDSAFFSMAILAFIYKRRLL